MSSFVSPSRKAKKVSYIKNCRPRTKYLPSLSRPIRTKLCRRRRYANIVIVGDSQTGKKTLAFRFSVMNQGPFDREIRGQYFYVATIDPDNRLKHGICEELMLSIFLVPPPSNVPLVMEMPLVDTSICSSMIFLCSVIDVETFDMVLRIIDGLSDQGGLPHFLVVGNMNDLYREDYFRYFTYYYADSIVRNDYGANYYECSAKENIGVGPILDEILQRIVTVNYLPDDY